MKLFQLQHAARIDTALHAAQRDDIIEKYTADTLRKRMIVSGAMPSKFQDSVDINV